MSVPTLAVSGVPGNASERIVPNSNPRLQADDAMTVPISYAGLRNETQVGHIRQKSARLWPRCNRDPYFDAHTDRNLLRRYRARYPPSTRRGHPVTNDASSEARKRIALAISSGCALRPIGSRRAA